MKVEGGGYGGASEASDDAHHDSLIINLMRVKLKMRDSESERARENEREREREVDRWDLALVPHGDAHQLLPSEAGTT